jgi:hypothetical protein
MDFAMARDGNGKALIYEKKETNDGYKATQYSDSVGR